jgi:hypothetical protein
MGSIRGRGVTTSEAHPHRLLAAWVGRSPQSRRARCRLRDPENLLAASDWPYSPNGLLSKAVPGSRQSRKRRVIRCAQPSRAPPQIGRMALKKFDYAKNNALSHRNSWIAVRRPIVNRTGTDRVRSRMGCPPTPVNPPPALQYSTPSSPNRQMRAGEEIEDELSDWCAVMTPRHVSVRTRGNRSAGGGLLGH